MDITIQRSHGLRGSVRVPGDKSISHRALILGSIARGTQIVRGVPPSDDVRSTIRCLRRLGVSLRHTPDGATLVSRGAWASGESIYAGNSGTTARLLSGLIAGVGVDCTIDGDRSLRRRPMERVAEPLRAMGARVGTARGGCLPMRIRGGELKGIEYRPAVASAQVKSAVLMAGLQAEGVTTVIEESPTRDHTERMLRQMGVEVRVSEPDEGGPRDGRATAVSVVGRSEPRAIDIDVPGDISSAMFLICAAAAVSGSKVRLPRTGVNPSRTGALRVMMKMGAGIRLEGRSVVSGEEVADIVVRAGGLKAAEIGGDTVPYLIDELPVLAVVATQAEGTTVVRGARELRYKESDRIDAIVRNLRLLGARVEEYEDGFAVDGPCALRGAVVPSHGDHRVAMAMAVAGLIAEGGVRVTDASVARVSYPAFFDDLRRLTG